MSVEQELKEVLEKLTKLKRVEKHLDELDIKERDTIEEMDSLERDVDKELADVLKLENVSLASLIHKVIGNKEEKIAKEKEEYLEKALSLKKARETLDLIQYEKSVLENKLINADQLTDRLEVLKQQRLDEILNTQSPLRSELLTILNKMDHIQKENLEIKEALHSLNNYKVELHKVYELLSRANYWATIYQRTSPFSGSLQRGRSRHNFLDAIDKSIYYFSKSGIELAKLQKELADIKIKYNPQSIDLARVFKGQIPFEILRPLFHESLLIQGISQATHLVQQRFNDIHQKKLALDKILNYTTKEYSKLNNEKENLILS